MDKERLFRNLERKYSSKCELAVNLPLGVNSDAIWEEVMQSRRSRSIQLPLYNVNGEAYWYLLTNKMISASEVIVEEFAEHDSGRQPHLSSVATIEEIYFTGFMEGAQISIQDAMNFLQSGEEPSNVEELILLNNRQAAGFAAENMYHAIDGNYLHNLAYFLTEGLDNGSGDFRITDHIEIPSMQGEAVKLPPASTIPELVDQFAAFLAETKTHPLIKAAAAQAWVLAVRPFPEGNERLARLLSNVILIRAGYSFFGEISISSVIARTSYEYFRAVANILRTENGADLTYFLEYYMTVLSGTVHELRARRDKRQRENVEEEQQLAKLPLSQASVHTAAQKNVQENYDEIIVTNSENSSQDSDAVNSDLKNNLVFVLKEKIKNSTENAAMVANLLLKYIGSGKYQFTSGEIAMSLNMTTTSVRNSIRFYSMKNFIQIIGDRDGCCIYEFCFIKKNENPAKTETPSCEPAVFLRAMKEENRGEKQKAAAKKLLKYYSNGKEEFSSLELAKEAGISRKFANNFLRMLEENKVIALTRITDRVKFFKFVKSEEKEVPEKMSFDSAMRRLQDLAGYGNSKKSVFAEIFIKYLNQGKMDFTAEELMKETGLNNQELHNTLRCFRDHKLIVNTKINFQKFSVYRFNIEMNSDESIGNYSENICQIISDLETSTSSSKDRRIGTILHKCLRKGVVSRRDYALEGAMSKWNADMRFAAQLGLVEKSSSDEYKILTELKGSHGVLNDSQKKTLSALYDFFGEDMFSAEMVVAKLDYSSSHISGILHQFTWLRLLDCTASEDNSNIYQLNVNPTDNPECFGIVA